MLKVAIVDDDVGHSRAFARLLRVSGMETGCFESAEAFLEEGSGAGFDCVVLDIQLGGMSGFDLQRRLTSSAGAPAVVFLSAHEEPETIETAARTGCAYLRKTDPGSLVLDAIRRAVSVRSPSPKG